MAVEIEPNQLARAWSTWAKAIVALALGALAANACTQTPESKVPGEPRSDSAEEECEQPNPAAFTLACVAWAEAQEAFAALSVEALRLGRIDPGIYVLDPGTGAVALNDAALPAPLGDELNPIRGALERINGDMFARGALTESYTNVNVPGIDERCPPITYAVTVTRAEDQEPGIDMYRWEFTGPDRPSEEQLTACFQALYGPVPEGCPVIPSVYATQGCSQVTGLFPSRIEPKASDAASSARATAAADARRRRCKGCGCCGNVGRYYDGSYCGSC